MIDEEARAEFARVCNPVIEWVRKYSDPHALIAINYTKAEMLYGEFSVVREIE